MLGSIMGGESERDAHMYNQRLYEQRAKAVEQTAASETKLMQERGRKFKATQEAGYAKSGAMIDSGTPLLVMAETAGDIQRDILEQRRNRTIQAQQMRSAGEMERYKGRMASRAGYMKAGTTLLGGIGQMGLSGAFSGGGGMSDTEWLQAESV